MHVPLKFHNFHTVLYSYQTFHTICVSSTPWWCTRSSSHTWLSHPSKPPYIHRAPPLPNPLWPPRHLWSSRLPANDDRCEAWMLGRRIVNAMCFHAGKRWAPYFAKKNMTSNVKCFLVHVLTSKLGVPLILLWEVNGGLSFFALKPSAVASHLRMPCRPP